MFGKQMCWQHFASKKRLFSFKISPALSETSIAGVGCRQQIAYRQAKSGCTLMRKAHFHNFLAQTKKF
jgi:hypothetical protein